ncbi:hypothetical protein MLD38_036649 [Melastoma candidum]|uniref:Uncharacterized protein n=1 Tax=Melastoma candidum TaxID=119954 RepID=A0ACB9LKS1_9MYRT|nr:hypothetical protein MLD38_036649 [Melastoma candidum]
MDSSSSTRKRDDHDVPRGPRIMTSTPLVIANTVCFFVGSVASSLLTKYYFIHGGSSRWVSTWVQSAGFPMLLFPIYLPPLLGLTSRRPFTGFDRKILLMSVAVGFLLGVNNLLFSWGTSYLPVSTSSLLLSSQLVFTLILSALIVRQKINFNNLNCVILLTVSSVLLALGSSSDRPPGLTRGEYTMGFLCTVGAGLLFALYLPVMERIYRRVDCYAMVVEMQTVMEGVATMLAMVGMACDGGFRDMKEEYRRAFDKGPGAYQATVASTVVMWQMSFMGTAGMIFLTSSITGGICMTSLLAVNVVGGVIAFGDKFGGVKAVSMVLCVWGFCSYLYGMHVRGKGRRSQAEEDATAVEMAVTA